MNRLCLIWYNWQSAVCGMNRLKLSYLVFVAGHLILANFYDIIGLVQPVWQYTVHTLMAVLNALTCAKSTLACAHPCTHRHMYMHTHAHPCTHRHTCAMYAHPCTRRHIIIVYMHMYAHPCTRRHTCAMYAHPCTRRHIIIVYMHAHAHPCTHRHTCACVCMHIHAHVDTHVHVHTCTYLYTEMSVLD